MEIAWDADIAIGAIVAGIAGARTRHASCTAGIIRSYASSTNGEIACKAISWTASTKTRAIEIVRLYTLIASRCIVTICTILAATSAVEIHRIKVIAAGAANAG